MYNFGEKSKKVRGIFRFYLIFFEGGFYDKLSVFNVYINLLG